MKRTRNGKSKEEEGVRLMKMKKRRQDSRRSLSVSIYFAEGFVGAQCPWV
jgi:hypothetical protein